MSWNTPPKEFGPSVTVDNSVDAKRPRAVTEKRLCRIFVKLIMVMQKFQIMTIRSLDLNLLRVFDAMARRAPRPSRAVFLRSEGASCRSGGHGGARRTQEVLPRAGPRPRVWCYGSVS